MKLLLAALLAVSAPVLADTPNTAHGTEAVKGHAVADSSVAIANNTFVPPLPPPADMVVLPRAAVEDVLRMLQAIAVLRPDLATQPVNAAWQRLTVCLQANGPGPAGNQCPEVAASKAAVSDPGTKPPAKKKP